jgi:hypothetical protein
VSCLAVQSLQHLNLPDLTFDDAMEGHILDMSLCGSRHSCDAETDGVSSRTEYSTHFKGRSVSGRAVAQAVSRRLPTASARVQAPSQVMWDLWRTERHWDRFPAFSRTSGLMNSEDKQTRAPVWSEVRSCRVCSLKVALQQVFCEYSYFPYQGSFRQLPHMR